MRLSGGARRPVELFALEVLLWSRQQISMVQGVFNKIQDSSI